MSATTTPEDFDAHSFDDGRGHTLPYRLFVPRGLPPGRKVPLVLFLHGSGGRGADNLKQLTDQPAPLVFVQPGTQARWPSFMLAPQCPVDQQWVAMPWAAPTGKGQRPAQMTWPLQAVEALVDRLIADGAAIDPAQLYVTGMSMGGFGTFDLAARAPKKWRAAVPICGGYDGDQVGPLVGLPLWAFHAEDDQAVPVGRTREIMAALRARGGLPRYTEYPASAGHGHFSWIPAYADPDLLPWMFGPHPTPDVPAAGAGAAATGRVTASASAATPVPAPPRQRGCACAGAQDGPPGKTSLGELLASFSVGVAAVAAASFRRLRRRARRS